MRVLSGVPPYLVNTVIAGDSHLDEANSTAILLGGNVPNPRLLGNAFGGTDEILRRSDITYRTVDRLNVDMDSDPEGGTVQLNVDIDPTGVLRLSSDGAVRTLPGSALVNAGIDLNLIGLRIADDYSGNLRPQGRTARSSGYDIGAEEVE